MTLRRNPYYRGERPHHVDRFEVSFTSTPTEVIDRIEAGTADWGWIHCPAWTARGEELMRKYRGSRVATPDPPLSRTLYYYILNTRRGIFRSAPPAPRRQFRRQPDGARQAAGSRRCKRRQTSTSAGDARGSRTRGSTRPTPSVGRAKKLARGRLGNRKVVLYTGTARIRSAEAQVVKSNLARIGLQVEIRQFAGNLLLRKIATPNEPYDMAWNAWTADYPDPYGVLNVVLGDHPYFKSPAYTRRLLLASRLAGAKRYREYARLDAELARKVAPLLAYMTRDLPTLVSRKVDRRCIKLRPALDLAAVCLKR